MTTFFERINFLAIIKNHVLTFYNNRDQKFDYVEFVIWLLFSFGGSLIICFYINNTIPDDFAATLFNAFAILGGFFINALVLLVTKKEDLASSVKTKDLLSEAFHNTAFGILLCVFAVILCSSYSLLDVQNKITIYSASVSYKTIFSFFIYATCLCFLHTLFMVLKRLNAIVTWDIR